MAMPNGSLVSDPLPAKVCVTILSYFTLLVPEKPSAKVTSKTATTISLSWTFSNGSLGIYGLVWISKNCPEEDKGNITITDGSTDYTIEGLEEDSNYTITVRVSNAAGSVVSDPVTGKTAEAGEQLNQFNEIGIHIQVKPTLFFSTICPSNFCNYI